jgi:hypothetical protein
MTTNAVQYILFLFLSIFLNSKIYTQPQVTYLGSIDPHNTTGLPYADRGKLIFEIDNALIIVNGYVDVVNPQLPRVQNLIKVNLDDFSFSNQITIYGPKGDLAITDGMFHSDGHLYFTGEWLDSDASKMKSFISKYNTDLEEIWTNYLDDLSNSIKGEYAFSICEGLDNGIAMVYMTDDNVPPNQQTWMLKADENGTVDFKKHLPAPLTLHSNGSGNINRTNDGNYFCTSYAYGRTFKYNTNRTDVREAALIHKVNPDGDTIWTRLNPGAGFTRFHDPLSTVTKEGDLAVAWIRDTLIWDEENYLPYFYGIDCYDPDGNLKWKYDRLQRTVSHVSIKAAQNGDIIAGGYFYEFNDTWYKAWVYRLSPQGELKWSRIYNDSINRHFDTNRFPINPAALIELDDGRIALTGWIIEESDHPQSNGVNPNVLLMILDSLGCLIPGCVGEHQLIDSISSLRLIPQPSLMELMVYPNPATSSTTIEWPNKNAPVLSSLLLSAFDSSGRKLWQDKWDGTSKTIDTTHWPPGSVVLICTYKNQPVAARKLIIQKK